MIFKPLKHAYLFSNSHQVIRAYKPLMYRADHNFTTKEEVRTALKKIKKNYQIIYSNLF